MKMDEFRYLSLFLNIRDFLSLTSCNKNLRRLYFEKGTIWKNFLERDFCYKYHPSHDVERYKECIRRKNINFSKRKEKKDDIELIFIDFNRNLSILLRKPLENWGLIYNNKPVLSTYMLNITVFCISIFSDYNVSNAIDLEDYGCLSDIEFEINRFAFFVHPFLVKNEETITIYKDKACDLFYKLAKTLYFFDFKKT